MDWLQPATAREPARRDGHNQQPSLAREFALSTVAIETDMDTGAAVITEQDGYLWVITYPDVELLHRIRGSEVNHMSLTGRDLRDRAKREGYGILFQPNRDDDQIIITWPKGAGVARIAVQ